MSGMEKNGGSRWPSVLGIALILLTLAVFAERRCLKINNLIQLLGAPLTFFLLFIAVTPLSIFAVSLLFRPRVRVMLLRFKQEKDLFSLAVLIAMILSANLAFLILPNLICSIWNLVSP